MRLQTQHGTEVVKLHGQEATVTGGGEVVLVSVLFVVLRTRNRGGWAEYWVGVSGRVRRLLTRPLHGDPVASRRPYRRTIVEDCLIYLV